MSYRDVVGLGLETTWNSAVTTPDYYPPVKAESLGPNRTLMESPETSGVPFPLSAEYGTFKYEGSLEGNIRGASFGLILAAALGSPTTTNPTSGVYQHVYDPVANDPNSVSILTVNRDPDTTVVDLYSGAMIDSMECEFAVDDYATFNCTWIAASLDDTQSDPTETLDTSQRFAFNTVKVYLDTDGLGYDEIDCSSAGFTYNLNLDGDEYILGATELNALNAQNRSAEVRFTPTEDISDHYRRALESSPTDCKLKVEATGAQITGAYYYKVTFEFPLVQYMSAPLDIDAGTRVKDIEVTARAAYDTSNDEFFNVTLINEADDFTPPIS